MLKGIGPIENSKMLGTLYQEDLLVDQARNSKKDGHGVNIALSKDTKKTCWDIQRKSVNRRPRQSN